MPKSWINLPMFSDAQGFGLANAACDYKCLESSLMDEWYFPPLGEWCAPMHNKNKYNQHDCISEKG